MMREARVVAVAAAIACAAGCGGNGVKPLNPKDPTLPLQARQWVADAEDGVIAARVRLRRARAEQSAVAEWASDLKKRLEHTPASLRKALAKMLDAHTKLRELSVRYAQAGESFAEAKYRAINAEQAVKLNTARADLAALRGRAAKAQDGLRDARKKLWKQRERVEVETDAWWRAYAEYVAGGGDTRALWIGDAKPISLPTKVANSE